MDARGRGAGVPRWFGALLGAAAGSVVVGGLVALVAAVFAAYSWPLALAAAAVGAGGGGALGWRVTPDGAPHVWAAGAVVVAGVFVVANWGLAGETVVLERDAGIYSNSARWLDRDGSLLVDAEVGPFVDAAGVSFVSVGMYDHPGEDIEFQSNHLTSALYATAYGAGGAGGLFRAPLVLVAAGLLAVWALAARVVGHGAVALVGVVALAASLPVLGVARDTLSEPVVLLLLWAGLWLWTAGSDTDRPLATLAAGLCLGGCIAARIDSAAYLVPVPIALALHGRRAGWRLVRPFVAGLLPGVAVAALDIGLRARGYLGDLEVEVALLYALLGVAVVAGVVVARWRGGPLPGGAALSWVVVAVLLLAWLVRPHVQTVLARDSPLVAAIQREQGLGVDGRRRYHELSMLWQSWYLGVPLLAAAVAGAGIVVHRLARGVDRALLLPLAALGAASALYLFRPAISPDHLWAMRRFVPATLPLWCVLAGVAVVALLRRLPARSRAPVAVATVALALAPVVATTWPVRAFREFDGFLAFVEQTCDVVGPDAAVVASEDDYVGASLTQTVRSWCGVPAAMVDATADLDALADGWAAAGRQLWLLEPSGGEVPLGPVSTDRMLEDTLTSAPDGYFLHRIGATATRVGDG
jgi:hypothetical protein